MPVDVTKTLGPLLIGQLLLTIIYGFTILQAYIYYTKHSSRDPWFVKSIVGVIGVLDTFHIAIGYHFTYYYLITAFADAKLLAKAVWSLQGERLIGAPQAVVVQVFFAYFLFETSKHEFAVPALLTGLAAGQLGLDIWWTIRAAGQPTVSGLLQATQIPGRASIAMGVAASFVIGAATLFYMHRSRADYSKVKNPFDWLISYTLKTCFIISVTLVIALGLLVGAQDNFFYYPPYAIATRLYANAMLSTLNNRLSRRSSHVGPASIAFNSSSSDPTSSSNITSSGGDVKVNKEVVKSVVRTLPSSEPTWATEHDMKAEGLVDEE